MQPRIAEVLVTREQLHSLLFGLILVLASVFGS
jgi:hypothetical protein